MIRGGFPKQRLTYKEKVANNLKWAKEVFETIEEQIETTDWRGDKDKDRMQSNYMLYANQLNQKDFERECNPLGFEVGQFRDEIQPYNKTYTKIDRLTGEEEKRPLNFRVVLEGQEGVSAYQRQRKELLQKYVMAEIEKEKIAIQAKYQQENPAPTTGDLQQAQQYQQQMEEYTNSVMNPEQIEKYLATEWREAREIMASNLLQVLIKKERIKEKKNDGFRHGLIAGEEHIWVGIVNGEPIALVRNPLGMFYHKSPDTKYIHEGLFAGYRTRMSIGDILDTYGEDMKESDKGKLETQMNISSMDAYPASKKMVYHKQWDKDKHHFMVPDRPEEGQYGSSNYLYDYDVTHIEWRSERKIGFLTYIDPETEEELLEIVDENFKLQPELGHISIDWEWIPEIWEGTRIGEDIFVNVRPKLTQHRDLYNPYKVRLGYHGIVYNNTNAPSVSLMERMKPFQYLYFIVLHKAKQLIAQDQGKVFVVDKTMIDKELGLEKSLYYIKQMNLSIINPFENVEHEAFGKVQRSTLHNSVDMSNMQHILNYAKLLEWLDDQIGQVAGVTKAREGQSQQYEAVGNNQQSIIQSSYVTEMAYFKPHNTLWQDVLQSLLECAQAAYEDKPLFYRNVLDDMSISILEMNPGEITNESFGLFISDAAKDAQVFEEIKQLLQPLIQNERATFSDVISALKADSISELERVIKKSEERSQQQQAQQGQMQQQTMLEIEEKRIAWEREKEEYETSRNDKDNETKIRVAEIQSFSFQTDQDVDDNNVPDQLEIDKFLTDKNVKERKIALEERSQYHEEEKLRHQKKIDEKYVEIDKKKANRPPSKSK